MQPSISYKDMFCKRDFRMYRAKCGFEEGFQNIYGMTFGDNSVCR